MEDWEVERIEIAKKIKVDEILRYFVDDHRDSGLKYACSHPKFPEIDLEHQTHLYLVREGFRWLEESNCFVGVTDRIYQDAKEIVSSALRRYSDIVKIVGVCGSVNLERDNISLRHNGEVIRLAV